MSKKKEKLFSTFSEEDIFRNGTFRGKKIPDETILAIIEQAKAFKRGLLWKMLKAELEWFALKNLVEHGEDADDLRYARLFGNLIRIVDKKLDKMA